MLSLQRTSSDHPDFRELVKLLDAELAIRDGKDHSFFAAYNKLDAIRHVVVARISDQPAGCGALKVYDANTLELKRMFVKAEYRQRGIARALLAELEKWVSELGYSQYILETGKNQPEAIKLYQSSGFKLIPNYGQYENVELSVCMKKVI